MKAVILEEAERDLERAFDYYEQAKLGLGLELLDAYRRGISQIIQHPKAWQPLDETYRRYRLHRFPYGVIYRIDSERDEIVIVATMHLSRKPDFWRDRDRG